MSLHNSSVGNPKLFFTKLAPSFSHAKNTGGDLNIISHKKGMQHDYIGLFLSSIKVT
jgi:hypothetical protein